MTDTAIDDVVRLAQSQNIAQLIESLIQDIRFGSIELVVHAGRIVQIDKHEKIRLNR